MRQHGGGAQFVITGSRLTIKMSRKLRSEMSLPEVMFWQHLRQRPGGCKFRRQHPAGDYVLDFYCAKIRLAIEIDGIAHQGHNAILRDANRSAFLRSRRIATTRIPALAVLEDAEPVIRRLIEICKDRMEHSIVPLHQPAAGSPPLVGEDK